MSETVEANFDGLVGPTHNYAGLAQGNVASAKNADAPSDPRGAVLQGLAGGDLALRVNGSGDLDASGRVDSLSVLLNGSGDARLGKLAAASAKVRINGSGDATVKVSGTLDAIVNGSGDIRYSGGAQVTSTIHGSGSVEKE